MPPPKPVNRIARAPRVPPVKYFAILHGAALMVGTAPGPGGDDFSRKWTLLNRNGRILPAHEMAARYFLLGEMGCEQIGAKAAANMASQFGGSLEELIAGEPWRQPQPTVAVRGRTGARSSSKRVATTPRHRRTLPPV